MLINRCRGGIHPLSKKQEKLISWRNSAIEIMPAPEKIYISLAQHIGKPATACVEKGQYVRVGELIARADGAVSANIHSSVSGIVVDILPLPNLAGNDVPTVIIDNDNQYQSVDFIPVSEITPDSIIKAAADMGIAGMGGATFPTHVKLNTKDKIDTVIINGAECEPYLTADDRLMREHPEQIIKGALLVKLALNAVNVIVGIESNKPKAIEIMESYAQNTDVKIKKLPKRYPMGAEKQLIYNLTGRIVKSGKLPSSQGCVVQNVATVNALYEAVYLGRPVTGRITTVAGSAMQGGRNLFIPIGSRICDVLTYIGVDQARIAKIISGGPMMGTAVPNVNASITKGSSGLLLLDENDAKLPSETPCIRCGRCVDACPMSLMPMRIDAAQRIDAQQDFLSLRAYDCIECGSCTFVCPAKRYLVQSIRIAKAKAMALLKEGKK